MFGEREFESWADGFSWGRFFTLCDIVKLFCLISETTNNKTYEDLICKKSPLEKISEIIYDMYGKNTKMQEYLEKLEKIYSEEACLDENPDQHDKNLKQIIKEIENHILNKCLSVEKKHYKRRYLID